MEKSNLNRNTFVIVLLIVVSFLLKASLARYGAPYLFHPDEPYIYKDSFKLLYAFSEKDFSLINNPYNLALGIWYAICYPVGELFGLWTSFADFKQQVLAESFNVIYCGRLFSLLLSITASLLLYRHFARSRSSTVNLVILLLVFFNPLEWISNLWIKFDPACYLVNVVLLIKLYSYKENKSGIRNIAVLLGIAFAVRMDFASYIAGFLLLSFFGFFPRLSLRSFALFCVVTGVTFLIATNMIGHWIFGLFNDTSSSVQLDEGFVSVFIKKMQSMPVFTMVRNMAENAWYYLRVGLIFSIPLILVDGIVFRFSSLRNKEFWLFQIFLLFILLVFNFSAPHYFLVTQVCYLFFVLRCFKDVVFTKRLFLISALSIAYFLSWSLEIFWYINFVKDPRIETAEYIYATTPPSAVVAVEGWQDIGFSPSVSECREQLLFKAKIAKERKMGTGSTFKAKAVLPDQQCRRVIELESENRYGEDSIAKTLVNVYNYNELIKVDPTYVIAKNDWNMREHPLAADFYRLIENKSKAIKIIGPDFADPRMKLLGKECFHLGFTLYRIK